ncbi:hypothetical protein BC938DRAFT_482314 [Jimgerdemannia flammicorona]|uniref:Uncharacterized protein n=1 Tax=Jimgerdemannia flammicorona TaxID=994334 RepID=A0A433QEP2_9FUNG|nr:hypothetical protein BC938DRAFT_482314 [Jimgerdemannia flammicorona]
MGPFQIDDGLTASAEPLLNPKPRSELRIHMESRRIVPSHQVQETLKRNDEPEDQRMQDNLNTLIDFLWSDEFKPFENAVCPEGMARFSQRLVNPVSVFAYVFYGSNNAA